MPKITPVLSDFTAGEISPWFMGRTDQPVYYKGARKLYNWMPRGQGSLRTRPGTQFIGTTASNAQAQLYSIKVSSSVQYVLEFTNDLVRFWKYAAGGSFTYLTGKDIITTYTTAELPNLQFAWMYPDLFITHQNHAPARIRWSTGDNFALAAVSFVTTTYTFTADTTNGSPTLKNLSNTALPIATQSGLWLLTGTGMAASTYLTAVYPSATPSVNIAALSATMNNNATATNTGVTLTLTQQPVPFQSSGNYPRCVMAAFQRVWFASTANSPQELWSSIVGVWDSTDPTGASAKMNMNQFEGVNYSLQQMVVDASGNPTTNPPQYQNIQQTQNAISDSDGIDIVLSETQSEVAWISAGRDFIVGCADGELVIPGTSTPNNISASFVSRTGSNPIQAYQMDTGVVFVQQAGQRVYQLDWQGAGVLLPPPKELTFFSEHMFINDAMTAFSFTQAPDGILYFLRGTSGTIASCHYNPLYGVMAWWQLAVGGAGTQTIQSMCVVSGSDRDVLVLSVNRNTFNSLEFLTDANQPYVDITKDVPVDCATVSINMGAVSSITTNAVFNSIPLQVIADGKYLGTATPSAGSLTLPNSASGKNIVVGFDPKPVLDTLPISPAGKYGPGLTSMKSIAHIRAVFYESLNAQAAVLPVYAGDLNATPTPQPASFRGAAVNVANPTPYTGDDRIPAGSIEGRQMYLEISTSAPLHCEVLALVPEVLQAGDE